jgi:hypothetical protein
LTEPPPFIDVVRGGKAGLFLAENLTKQPKRK